ncbi:T cell receptor delta constant isoform X2 [Erpetoichthys calabaricus]|uniref:T cell receptor delta constant isoform X2 n=1 Tax=Erpetoichthys calabaricus TaxID=27687 RepID=UPI00223475EA|nr:T cell receptor delta constant isoform X2 [Erpetoichthys calabaricus]
MLWELEARPLTFGKGTKLTVKMKDQNPTGPQLNITVIKTKNNNKAAVCLASDFYSSSKNLILTSEGKDLLKANMENAALSLTKKLYSFAGVKEINSMKELTCNVDNKTVSYKENIESTPSTINATPPTKTCNATDAWKQPESNDLTKINFLSLTVNGLRVLLAKCVAFNLLMTARATIF